MLNVVGLFEDMNWINLTRDRIKWRSTFNTQYPSLMRFYAVSLHEYLIKAHM